MAKTATELYTEEEKKDTTVYDDAQAQLERDGNYKAYYNKAIQLYNMQQNTNKHMNTMLQNSGLSGSGYGSSMQAGANNQAMNLYAQNMSDYASEEAKITSNAYQRYQTQQTEQDNQMATYLGNSTTDEEWNKHMYNYGYMDENGQYTDKWEALPEERKAYFTSLYDTTIGAQSNKSNVPTYTNDSLSNIQYKDNKGNIKNVDDKTVQQVQYYANSGQIDEGAVIALGAKNSSPVYLKYENGQYVRITEKEYSASDNRYYFDKYGATKNDEKLN